MRGFEGFFSPLQPRLVVNATPLAGRRPWDGQEEEKSSSERDPTRSPPSASAGAPSSEEPSQHPELAPPSTSSFGSIPSPVRESNRPGNNRELRQRLTARATPAQAPSPGRAPRQDFGYHDPPERRWPASRVFVCRICACLAIVAFLGIVLLTRLIIHSNNGNASLEEVEPGGDGDVRPSVVAAPETVDPMPPTVMLEELWLQGALQPQGEDGEQLTPLELMPVPPAEEAPEVLAETPLPPTVPTGIDTAPVEGAIVLEGQEQEEKDEGEGEGEGEACWILLHMEKSGGGAVRQVASEFWRKDALVYDTVQWRRGDSYAEDVMNSHWKLLHGGCAEALRTDKARPCQWLTIFRHPVARLLSAYDHCREAPKDPLCPPTKSKDLAAFAERWGNFAMRQFALASVSQSAVKEWAARAQVSRGVSVWYLVKEYLTRGGVAEDVVLEGLLRPAQDLLSTRYAAVGVAAELDTTMRLFEKALSAEGLGWSSALSKLRRQDMEEDVEYDNPESTTFRDALANPRIASALRLDVLLYDHALSVFQKQVVHYGVS